MSATRALEVTDLLFFVLLFCNSWFSQQEFLPQMKRMDPARQSRKPQSRKGAKTQGRKTNHFFFFAS
jgi:hypothetical protein